VMEQATKATLKTTDLQSRAAVLEDRRRIQAHA
jgi:hypothetical protein